MREIPKANAARLASFKKFVGEEVAKLPKADIAGTAEEFEEWLDSTSYNESRKNQLREARESLGGGRPTKRQASRIAMFGKREAYTCYKHLRLINSRSDVFKAWSGPLFKAVERIVYDLPEFIKHVPVAERPERIRALKMAGRRYFATDFTAYESHFTSEFLDACECQLYRHCLSNFVDVDFLCDSLMGWNKLKSRVGVRAEVRGRRMSGDMCTSLGNGFANLMLAKFMARELGGSIEGYVEGDDGIFSSTVCLSKEAYASMGFTIKIEEVEDPCTASFCGLVFSESGEIIRDPRRFVSSFGWTQSFLYAGDKIMDELLRAKALSAAYETPQCPIVGAFARQALRFTRHSQARFVEDGYHHPPPDETYVPLFCPSEDTRHLFAQLYGIPSAVQRQIELHVELGEFAEVAKLMPPCQDTLDYDSRFVSPT